MVYKQTKYNFISRRNFFSFVLRFLFVCVSFIFFLFLHSVVYRDSNDDVIRHIITREIYLNMLFINCVLVFHVLYEVLYFHGIILVSNDISLKFKLINNFRCMGNTTTFISILFLVVHLASILHLLSPFYHFVSLFG